MRIKRFLLVGLALAAGLLFLVRGGASQQDLDPVKIAPDTHKLLLENKFLRVIEAKVPSGGVEPKHSHPHGVTVYLSNYTVEMKTFPDGKITRAERKFGTVTWSDAIVHEVRNIGKTPSHAIRIELKH